MRQPLLTKLNKHIRKERAGDPKPASFYPSAASATVDGTTYGACRREQFLDYLKRVIDYDRVSDKKYGHWYETCEKASALIVPNSSKLHWIFAAGERHEEQLIEEFKNSNMFDSEQIQIYIPNYDVSGRIDLIAHDPDTDLKVIVEVKSVYGPAAESVFGSDYERRNKIPGTPKEANLMQIALYQHWYANPRQDFENIAELIYGERGNGDSASFEVAVNKGTTQIAYRQVEPYYGNWTFAPYKVLDILDTFAQQKLRLEGNELPPRDFSLVYTDEEMLRYSEEAYDVVVEGTKDRISVLTFLDNGDKNRKFEIKNKKGVTASLTKASAEQFIKYYDRKKNGGREVKKPVEGSKKCQWCKYQKFCYPKGTAEVTDTIATVDDSILAEAVSQPSEGTLIEFDMNEIVAG